MKLEEVIILIKLSVIVSMVKVIIGGGDGTVMWLIEDLKNSDIDIRKCIFGVVPLGNSNDLSNALGWGGKLNASSDMEQFKNIVIQLAEATSIFVDVWEMRLQVDEVRGYIKLKDQGEIIQFTNDMKTSIVDNITNLKLKTLRKTFINYFSLGYDARVGFGKKSSYVRI